MYLLFFGKRSGESLTQELWPLSLPYVVITLLRLLGNLRLLEDLPTLPSFELAAQIGWLYLDMMRVIENFANMLRQCHQQTYGSLTHYHLQNRVVDRLHAVAAT